jgi:hypothetical protein
MFTSLGTTRSGDLRLHTKVQATMSSRVVPRSSDGTESPVKRPSRSSLAGLLVPKLRAEIRTASGGNSPVFSSLSPLAVPLLLTPLDRGGMGVRGRLDVIAIEERTAADMERMRGLENRDTRTAWANVAALYRSAGAATRPTLYARGSRSRPLQLHNCPRSSRPRSLLHHRDRVLAHHRDRRSSSSVVVIRHHDPVSAKGGCPAAALRFSCACE